MSLAAGKTGKVKKEKEKSSKKRTAAEADEATENNEVESVPAVETAKVKKEKKDKSSNKAKSENASEANEHVDTDLTSDPSKRDKKAKKDKSNKKRKADVTGSEDNGSDSNGGVIVNQASEDVDGRPSKKRKSAVPEGEIEVDVKAPEPPSKKELRRLKKGKSIPKSKIEAPAAEDSDVEETVTVVNEDGTTTTTVTKKEKPSIEKRSEHGIWIGNLPFSVQEEHLRKFFTDNTTIEDKQITRVHMPAPDDGKPANRVQALPAWKKRYNEGWAYVDFTNPHAVRDAVALSEKLLQGRNVLIKSNKSFDGRPMKAKDSSGHEIVGGKEPSKRIFIGNLRFDANEENIKEHFEQCGEIDEIMIATFEDSGKCKGYGWITFHELKAAEAAVRGWIEIEEEPEEDSESSSSDADSDDEVDPEEALLALEKTKAKPTKKPRVRRRYIDKIATRPIRREFAEPAQVRYKKRYGKDGTKNKLAAAAASNDGPGAVVSGDSEPAQERTRKPKAEKEYESLGTSYAPRLTGAIRKPEGKKVVF